MPSAPEYIILAIERSVSAHGHALADKGLAHAPIVPSPSHTPLILHLAHLIAIAVFGRGRMFAI